MVRVGFFFASLVACGSAMAACPSPQPPYPTLCYLGTTWQPEAVPYTPPQCGSNVNSQEAQLIRNALDLAPPKVRGDLCKITTIFISDQSLGVWENPTQGYNRYIFLSGSVINNGNGVALAPSESSLQNTVLDLYGNNSVDLVYNVDPDSRTLGVLAVLAHEAGHVKWYADQIINKGCFKDDFIATSWKRDARYRNWVTFAEDDASNDHDDNETHPRKRKLTPARLERLYRRFASVFAAVSPDEDFIEAYKLSAILPNVTVYAVSAANLAIDIKGGTANSGRLKRKLDCIANLP